MKIRIKNGEVPEYLTVGKVYDVSDVSNNISYKILDDVGDYIKVVLGSCPHLNWGSWEVVDESTY